MNAIHDRSPIVALIAIHGEERSKRRWREATRSLSPISGASRAVCFFFLSCADALIERRSSYCEPLIARFSDGVLDPRDCTERCVRARPATEGGRGRPGPPRTRVTSVTPMTRYRGSIGGVRVASGALA